MPHWGDEYKEKPNKDQKDLAYRALTAGAAAVIGTHPHVLQPQEIFITPDGRSTLIEFSSGNFISAQKGTARPTTKLYRLI